MTVRARKRNQQSNPVSIEVLMDLKIPKALSPTSPFPNDMTRKMLFHAVGVKGGAAAFQIFELRCNAAYQPDAASSPPGFSQLAAIYNSYKVTHVRVRYNVCSNEPTIPVFFGLIFRDQQPSAVLTTYALAVESLSIAPTSGPEVVGETQGMSVYKSKWYKIMPAAIVGNALDYYGSTTFEGGSAANPTDLTWVALIMYSYASGTNLTNGAFYDFYLEMTTRFYSLKIT